MAELGTIVEFDDDISDATEPKPIPVGDYIGTITKAGIVQAKSDPTKSYVAVAFFIPPEQYPADFLDGSPEGMTLIYRRLQNDSAPRTKWQWKQFCQAIGAPTSRKMDVAEWVGRSARITVSHEDYEGSPRAQINKVSMAA